MKKKLLKIKNVLTWNFERLLIRNGKKILKSGLPHGKKIVLVPHSDDEWIGCSQIIKNERDTVIVNMNMDGNDNKDIHKIRYNEMQVTSRKYGIKIISLRDDKVNHLSEIIEQENPKYICVPYYIDWHDEHIEVMHILRKVLRSNDNYIIIMYQVSLPICLDDITNYYSLNRKDWKKKWIHFKKTYKTQSNFPWYRFATNERINGSSLGCFAAETYSIVSCEQWKYNLSKKRLTDEQRENIKKILSSIKKTRNYLNNIKQ